MSGFTCLPVKQEMAGSNPVAPARDIIILPPGAKLADWWGTSNGSCGPSQRIGRVTMTVSR